MWALSDLTVALITPLPAGYSATLTPATVLPGELGTLTVTLESATAGVYGGTIQLDTNDRDEDPFRISVTGLVEDAVPPPVGSTVIDNDDDPLTFASTGGFTYVSPDTRYVDNDYRYARGGSETATWTFPAFAEGGYYDIGATWAGGSGRDVAAPFTVLVDGVDQWTTTIDQGQNPDDFPEQGIMWERLGTVYVTAGQTLSVELSTDGTTGYVHADAVLAVTSTSPEIAVFDGTTELVDEVSQVQFVPGVLDTKTFTVTNEGGVNLTLSEPISVPLGFSLDQSFTQLILPPGASTTFVVSLNSDTPGGTTGRLQFGSDDTDESVFEFDLLASSGVMIVDDGDPRVHRSQRGGRLHALCLQHLL